MRQYQIINKLGEVKDSYPTLETARTFRRINNIITPGHTVKIFPQLPDKELEVGDQYIDALGFVLTVTKIDKEDNILYIEDIDKRYGDWKGQGAIFQIDSFKLNMQRI